MPITAELKETRTESSVHRQLLIRGDTVHTVEYAYGGDLLPGPLDLADSAALATLHLAMRTGQDLHIDGPVSAKLLENLEELQRAWAILRSDLYQPVAISAAEEVGRRPAADPNTAVLAFSQGVDSTAALISHLTGRVGRRRREIKSGLLVHGFDIHYRDLELFRVCEQHARKALETHNIPLSTVSTNWRSICGKWDMEYMAALASCMTGYAGQVSTGIVAADDSYLSFSKAWGSNPFLNRLLGSDTFEFQTDNYGTNRCDKVGWIAEDEALSESIRVCWQRPTVESLNCGKCEKCVRTHLNYMAHGKPSPQLLGDPPELWRIALMPLMHKVHRPFQQETLARAAANGIREPWTWALRFAYYLNGARVLARPLEFNVVRPLYDRARGR